jgi:hypothetical protein
MDISNIVSAAAVAVTPSKIFLGLNFYGVDFVRPDSKGKKPEPERKPIVAKEFLQVLQKVQPKLTWDAESSEHMLKYKVRKLLLLPPLLLLYMLSHVHGVGMVLLQMLQMVQASLGCTGMQRAGAQAAVHCTQTAAAAAAAFLAVPSARCWYCLGALSRCVGVQPRKIQDLLLSVLPLLLVWPTVGTMCCRRAVSAKPCIWLHLIGHCAKALNCCYSPCFCFCAAGGRSAPHRVLPHPCVCCSAR